MKENRIHNRILFWLTHTITTPWGPCQNFVGFLSLSYNAYAEKSKPFYGISDVSPTRHFSSV